MLLYLFVTIAWREVSAFDNSDDKWDQLQRHVLADLQSFCPLAEFQWHTFGCGNTSPGSALIPTFSFTLVVVRFGHELLSPAGSLLRRDTVSAREDSSSVGSPDPVLVSTGWPILLKAMDPAEFRYVGLDQQHLTEALGLTHYTDRQQGKIQLQRYGMSRNLASKARAECCDWREMRDLDAYKRALHEPYFALLQRNPALQPPDPALSRVEQLIVRYNDPGVQPSAPVRALSAPTTAHKRRLAAASGRGSANRSVTFT